MSRPIVLELEAAGKIAGGIRDCIEYDLFARCIPIEVRGGEGEEYVAHIFITTNETTREMIHRALDLLAQMNGGHKIEAVDREGSPK